MRDRIYVTQDDHDKLRQLIAGRRGSSSPVERGCLDLLEGEIDRAEVVEPRAVPRDVVTMHSEVRLEDLDSGHVQRARLVFPHEFRWDNSLSILAPVGTALLGYREGDVIEWPVPRGRKRLRILEVKNHQKRSEPSTGRIFVPLMADSVDLEPA